MIEEWKRRGAVLLASGAIVTRAGENTTEFRTRAYAWIRGGGLGPEARALLTSGRAA